MTIDKPDTLNLSFQPFDWRGNLHQSFTAGFGFDLLTGKLLAADAAFAAAMQALAPGDCMDTGLPKKQAEWLLAANACAPAGTTVPGLVVDMRVGSSSRRLLITGDKPFASMPLIWANTWGTPEENPAGLPPAQVTRAPVADAALPFGAPACPGPRGAWLCRMKRMGTYDGTWLKSRWPGVPDDFDWSFFNLAQPAQLLPEGIRGNETVELASMHPEHPRLSVSLPGKKVRLFLERHGAWSELAMTADTIWLFPNQLAGIVLWHGMTTCADEKASDITAVRLQLEPEDEESATGAAGAGAENTAEDGTTAAAGASGPDAGSALAGTAFAGAATSSATAAELLRPSEKGSDKLPGESADSPRQNVQNSSEAASAEMPGAPSSADDRISAEDISATLSAQLDESLGEINSALTDAGLAPLTEEQLAETRAHLNAMAQNIEALEAEAEKPLPALNDLLRKAGVPEERIAACNKALDLTPPDPGSFGNAASWQSAVDAYVAAFSALMQPSDEVREDMKEVLRAQGPGGDEALIKDLGAAPVDDARTLLVQAGMEPAAAANLLTMLEGDIPSDLNALSSFAGKLEKAAGFPDGSVSEHIDAFLRMLDEAGLKEDGEAKEATRAVPSDDTAAPLPEENPQNAEPASSPQTPPSDEKGDEEKPGEGAAPDRNAVLLLLAGGGSLAGLSLAGADLSGLDLSGRDMTKTVLREANLSGSRLDGCALSGADLAGANLSGCSLTDADLSGATLAGASAPDASFVRSRLDGADLSSLNAPDADFGKASLAGATLAGASLAGASFLETAAEGLNASGAALADARLRFCNLKKSVFDGADLSGADIHNSVLDGASFRSTRLEGTTFCYGTSVEKGNFSGSSLKGGVWTDVKAAGCTLTGVGAAGCVFTDCDLSGADLRGADAKNGDFSRTCLRGADMRGVNLFRGSLREACLEHADLSGSSLYGVDMYRIRTDAGTNFDRADCTATVLAARREV